MAQNGPATGGERPVAGGANGAGPYYGHVYRMDTGTGPMGIYIPTTRVTTGIGGVTKQVGR